MSRFVCLLDFFIPHEMQLMKPRLDYIAGGGVGGRQLLSQQFADETLMGSQC